MPPVSGAQKKAMWAASEGHSKLGIPAAIGKEFVGADAANLPIAAGIVFVAPDGDVLLLRRASTEPNYGGYWGLPGGKAEDGEGPEAAAIRETGEEIGLDIDPDAHGLKLMDRAKTPNGTAFSTFAKPVDDKFVPKLDGEHSGYAWAPLNMLPMPLHPSVQRTLGPHIGVANDMQPEQWSELRQNFTQWTREEEAEGEHAFDSALSLGAFRTREGRAAFVVALDSASARRYDDDGRMHIARTPITKANVCPYRGREIPDWENLGLDPEKIYQLYRDPEELAKAARTFNNLELLSEHEPITVHKRPKKGPIVGSIGSEAEFEHPYLYNSLAVWDHDAIKGVEDESKRELSSGYRYDADMTPGEIGGIRFDGVMRNIRGNHVALVEEGRAGADVMAADSALKTLKELLQMKSPLKSLKAALVLGATTAYLAPKLAQDAKIDLSPAFAGVNAKNFKAKKAAIKTAIEKEIDGKLAQDASAEGLCELLDQLETVEAAEEGRDEMPANAAVPLPVKKVDGADEDPWSKGKEFLNGKLSADDMSALDAIMGPKTAGDEDDESEEDKKKREAKEKEAADKKMAGDEDKVSKTAMDAALKKQRIEIQAEARATREAIAAVRPRVGELDMAFDTAGDVYKAALEHMGVKLDGVPASGYRAIFDAMPAPTARREDRSIAMDSKGAKSFETMFPGSEHIGQA